jgi:hypothetical protein
MATKAGCVAAMSDTVEGDPDPSCADFSAAEYCHLAEECFFMAAITKDSEAAAELVKAGDDYLRRAAEWLADQVKNA